MIFQEYSHEAPSHYARSRLNAAATRWHSGSLDAFTSAAEETHGQYTILGWMIDEARESFLGPQTEITKEEWNKDHYLWREDVKWTPDLTVEVAEVRRNRSDRLRDLSFRRANVDFWSLPNLSGTLLGAMGSPENLVAWGGMIGRAGSLVGQTTGKMATIGRYLKPIPQGATDAFVADTLFQTVKAGIQLNRGEDIDLLHAGIEVALATATGGILGTVPMALQIANKVPNVFRPALMKKSLNDIANGKPVQAFKGNPRRHVEEELNPEAKIEELNQRMEGFKDTDAELTKDFSLAAGKEYVQHTVGGVRKLINKVANCVRNSS
jgi:hypothetical protein